MKTRKTLKLFVKVNTQSPDHFPTESGDCYFPIAIFTGLRPEITEFLVFR